MKDFETAFSKHIQAHMEILAQEILVRLEDLVYKDLRHLPSEEKVKVINTKLFKLLRKE